MSGDLHNEKQKKRLKTPLNSMQYLKSNVKHVETRICTYIRIFHYCENDLTRIEEKYPGLLFV